MGEVSTRISQLSESQTIAMAKRSRELKAEGKDIISLSLGEPDFPTPDFIKEAAKKAIDENYSSYTPVAGYQELREAISRKFKRDNNIDYRPDEIVVSTGAKQSIANVVLSLVNPGDEVLLPAPYWVSYLELVKLAEGVPVIIPTAISSDFKITAKQLEKALTPKTKMMIYSSPCNPTGSIYSKEELKELASVIASKKDFYIISDEIYEHINFIGKHESLAQFSEIKEQVITINGVSKGFAMTGWRMGFIGAPKWIADACDKMQGQITSGACSITQRAVIAAMDADPSVTYEMKAAFEKRKELVIAKLQEIPGIHINNPKGAFYAFPDVSALFGKKFNGRTIENATDLCMYLLEEAEVAVVTGEAFGSPECIRISYATSIEVLQTAMQRIAHAISQLEA
jgi:aspartate aminotransferase